MIYCRTDLFNVTAFEFRIFSLSPKLLDFQSDLSRWLSCVYGLSSNFNRENLIELNDLGNLVDGAWCVGGDFQRDPLFIR